MTVASTFVPQQGDGAPAEARRQEPSMEDILASIRRIIADDQTQATRSGYGEPELPPEPAAASAPDEAVASAAAVDRQAGAASPHYEEVLDLASVRDASFTQSAPVGYEEPVLIASEPEPVVLPEPEPEPAVSPTLGYGSLPERDAAVPDRSPERRNGQFSSSRFRAPRTDPGFPQANPAASPLGGDPASRGERESVATAAASEDEGDSLISPALGASVMSAFETLAATVMLQNTEMLERIMRELLRPLVKVWLDENLPTMVERLVRSEIERVARGGRG